MKQLICISFLLCFCLSVGANNGIDPDKKSVIAFRTQQAPQIDGRLDEEIWLSAPPAVDFVQLEPQPGAASAQRTDVRILYDNEGIYVGARLYDEDVTNVQKELSERDNLRNTDWFGIFIDAFRGGINGFGFIVTPSDVQFDSKYSTFGEDEAWDAVWESKTSITEDGWIAEMKIPYSALRFPDANEQTWHVNFGRAIARTQEKSFWSTIDPQVDGFLNQSGYLTGIKDISPPIRLQATPFIALYGLHHHDRTESPINTYGRSINGGMDVKLGLSDAFTLDMTLIPDFGEAQSDNQVLNLSPFEVRFDENRAFFTEGTELFNKGGLFYSRRVGGRPIYQSNIYDDYDDDQIISNPQQSQLINATKISGRTAKGTGLGFFNATSSRTYATVEDPELGQMNVLTDPLTNYNVFVVDQNLPNNSYATLINTTVLREGDAYDANVTGTDFLLRNKANSYSIGGRAVLSQKYFPDSVALGHTNVLRLRKTSGNWLAGLTYAEESDTYDPNDLGFLRNNNAREWNGFLEYNRYEPFGAFNRAGLGFYAEYNRLFAPSRYTESGFNIWAWAQTRNFWRMNVWTYFSPGPNYNYFEPREDGRVWQNPGLGNIGFFIRSDSRKRLQLRLNGNFGRIAEAKRYNIFMNVGARYRVNDHFNFNLGVERGFSNNNTGYVTKEEQSWIDPETGEEVIENDIIFGRRDRVTVETFFRANYTFNANMNLSLRMRHYWSKVDYNSFHLLQDDGLLGSTDYSGEHNTDFDAFNVDLIYRWRFAPGSDIFIVWKNSITSYIEGETAPTYFKDLNGLFREPQNNSISLKIIYFLDYASLFPNR